MTDLAIPGLRRVDFTTEAARARVRARYRAETRFKAYGLIAIGLTAALPRRRCSPTSSCAASRRSFNTSWCSTLKVEQSEIDPQGTRDPAAIRAGDYLALVRDALARRYSPT